MEYMELVWHMTVPASWPPEGRKTFTRLATKAGIGTGAYHDNGEIHVIDEPEALVLATIRSNIDYLPPARFIPATSVITLEMKHDSIELTMCSIVSNDTVMLREPCQSQGSKTGGAQVDDAFLLL
jgi:hypothetical protein